MEADFSKVEESLSYLMNQPFTSGAGIGLHGGEPTLVPHTTLEKYIKLAESYNKPNGNTTTIVTNGSRITPKLVKLFKKYNMSVAVSADGPPHLNILRGPDPSDEEITRVYNKSLMNAIKLLRKNKIPTSIMCVLHTENCGNDEKLMELTDWLDTLAAMGVTGGRLNQLESNFPWTDKYELSNERLIEVYSYLFEWNNSNKLRYLPMREWVDNLLGYGNSPCIYGECDWYQTNTTSILPDGTITNCDRTFGEGLHCIGEGAKGSRQSALLQTEEECEGCKYWTVCYGGCPSEARDGDWRNKTKFCEMTYGMYEFIENKLRGLFPNIKLKIDENYSDPFIAMSYAYNTRCSSWGNYKPRVNNQTSNTSSPAGIGELVPKDQLPSDLDPNLPWRYAPGGYHADQHTDIPGGDQQ